MDHYELEAEHPKKRRRREILPRPVSARVTFDQTLKGDAVSISEQLWSDLGLPVPDQASSSTDLYIAISPSSPLHVTLQDSAWTIVPINPIPFSEHDSSLDQQHQYRVKLNAEARSSQAFLKVLTTVDPMRYGSHLPKSVDIRVVPASPLMLDTIYVSVERGLLEKVDELQNKFGGGFHSYGKLKKQLQKNVSSVDAARPEMPIEDRLTTVVRDALSSLTVIHSGDLFPLPLPSHPITHVRPAPAVTLGCEPVSQGRISQKTKVVVVQAGSTQEKTIKKLTPTSIVEESLEDTAEDTANDQFYSAAEDRSPNAVSEVEIATDEDSVTEDSDIDPSDEESDSMDDLISLSAPGLPPQPAGTLSAMTAATPRPGAYRASGTHTPGSVYSSFTNATAKAGNRPGKVFRTESLLRPIPPELLHPRPSAEDDDEAAVYVDITTLAKIGCFSGDWVRIEVARNVNPLGFPTSAFRSLDGQDDDEDLDWRVVRIYGLSGILSHKPRYAVDKTGQRRSSFAPTQSSHLMMPLVYLSPVLLTNISNASFLKIGALPKAPRPIPRALQVSRPAVVRSPPLAREVKLLMISTPLTTDIKLQSILFSALGAHFEKKRRVLKQGDYIAIAVDEELGRVTAQAGATEATPEHNDVAINLGKPEQANRRGLNTAWFYVENIDHEATDRDELQDAHSWGQVAVVDVQNTRLTQSGKTIRSIPDSIEAWTRFWLGMKIIPSRPGRAFDPLVTTADIPNTEKMPLEKRIADLAAASTSPRAINLGLPPLAILLQSNQRQVGKSYIASSACAAAGLHTFTISCIDLITENASTTGGGDVKTEALLQMRAERAFSCGITQTALIFKGIDLLTADRMTSVLKEIIASSRVLIATTTKIDDVPDGIRSLFTHEFEVGAPDEHAREIVLRNASMSTALPLSPNINLKNLALQTAALVAGDLVDVVDRASLARSRRLLSLVEQQSCSIADVIVSGGQFVTHLSPVDFSTAISAARSTFSDAIGAPKIPTVTWQDVGGLSSQKDAILETISLPLTRPELFANGVRKRSGILFYGPPGTGKTLLAKAIATEFSLNFFSVKGPELLNMYIGESEANVRRVFQKARDARPCVVFFDELDSVAPKRGNQGDSGGVMDRIVSQLLAELDGMSAGGKDSEGNQTNNGGGVFVIGATNRPDLLDPALLRPGRFDKMLYLGVADSHDSQVTILEALTRKFTLDPDVNLRRIAERLPFTYTGADLYALCSDSMLKAITRKTKAVDAKVAQISLERGEEITTNWFFDHLATEADTQVVVNEQDFMQAQHELVGSVSAKELEHFERIRGLFEDQDITKVDTAPKKAVHNSTIAPSTSASPSKGKGRQQQDSNHNSYNSTSNNNTIQPLSSRYANPDSLPSSETEFSPIQSSPSPSHSSSNSLSNDYGIGSLNLTAKASNSQNSSSQQNQNQQPYANSIHFSSTSSSRRWSRHNNNPNTNGSSNSNNLANGYSDSGSNSNSSSGRDSMLRASGPTYPNHDDFNNDNDTGDAISRISSSSSSSMSSALRGKGKSRASSNPGSYNPSISVSAAGARVAWQPNSSSSGVEGGTGGGAFSKDVKGDDDGDLYG